MPRITTGVVWAMMSATAPVAAQGVADTTQRVLDLHAIIERHGEKIGPLIWPGFRPDTIPTLYVIAHRGKVLVQWRHDWPNGFTPVEGRREVGVAGTQVVHLPSGRFISFMSVDSSMSPGLVLGTSIHEAFHSFERSVMREGRMFGGWENAMLVGRYPVFDVENEAAFALEGRKLRQALSARSSGETRRLLREFLAVRTQRQSRLDRQYVEFERLAEMNEGLAQYALIRGLEEVARREGGPWVARAQIEKRGEAEVLDSLLFLSRRSVRRRFYATGSAIALLLDRLADPAWKHMVLEQNTDLQETLGLVLGNSPDSNRWTPALEAELAATRRQADGAVSRLKASRTTQADSLLALPGVRLTIDPSGLGPGALQWCGFDPQNTLQTGDGRTMHLRFLKVCAGPKATAEFEQPVVQTDSSGVLRLVLDSASLRLSRAEGSLAPVEGETAEVASFRLVADGVSLEAGHARVTRRGRDLAVLLLPGS